MEIWPFLLVACCGAAPIFADRPDNPWDELRHIFYSHKFTNGEVYEHDVSLDYSPWTNMAPFYNNEQFYARVLAALDAFLKQSEVEVEKQSPVRRAILLRDLWPVFDVQTSDRLVKKGVAADRQMELRKRLAKIMQRLELSDGEVKQLPDNFKAAGERKQFLNAFDSESPENGFLPPDLLNETGPWVAMSRGENTLGALGHVQLANYRSIFVPYIRVSADRQETLDYLEKYRKRRIAAPKGTMLALVRHMTLPTTSGHIMRTSVMESLQLIVVNPPEDYRYKFVLNRAELIAGRPGLRMLTRDDPVDAYSFENGGLYAMDPQKDADGEVLVLGRFAGPVKIPSLSRCAACHGGSIENRFFANTSEYRPAIPTTWANQARMILSKKEESPEWKLYRESVD